jgi:ribose transport system permease protein
MNKKLFVLLSKYRVVALLGVIGIYSILFGFIFPATYPTYGNVSKVLMSMSVEAFIVVGMAVVLIGGEIDLSLGSNMALSGIICCYLIKFAEINVALAILITLVFSLVLGLINGFIVAKLGVNSFITTLATGLIYQGAAVWLAGPGLSDFPKYFQAIGQKLFLHFQLPVWYTLVIIAVFTYLMSNTRFFRQYYYIGGNVKAAILSGINIEKMKIIAFVVASLLASIAGIISAARFNSAMTAVGGGSELRAVTAAVIGGVSFTGGTGSMIGAAVGALFISLLNNGLVIAGVEPYWQNVATGAVLILAIVIDILIVRKKS